MLGKSAYIQGVVILCLILYLSSYVVPLYLNVDASKFLSKHGRSDGYNKIEKLNVVQPTISFGIRSDRRLVDQPMENENYRRALGGGGPSPTYNDDHATDDHATDDHAADDHATDDHGGGHDFPLFGGMAKLETESAALSFLIIIGCVVFLEHFFHEIHSATHDTPFADMVSAIEKELMIVGSMAFALKIIIATTDFLPLDWFHGLEFADILVPITSFMFCSLGFLLILMSIKETEIYRKSYHLHMFEILDEYYVLFHDEKPAENGSKKVLAKTSRFTNMISPYFEVEEIQEDGSVLLLKSDWNFFALLFSSMRALNMGVLYYSHNSPFLHQIVRWIPIFSPSIYGEMEFRIFHVAFCEHFEVQHNALQFDEYVRRIFEKYILNIITIDPANWALIILLGSMYFLKETLHFSTSDDCFSEEAHSAHEIRLQDECYARESVASFYQMGIFMLVLNIMLAILARFYEFRVLGKCAIHSAHDYANFLQTTESAQNHRKKEHNRLSADELKTALSAAKEKILFRKTKGVRSCSWPGFWSLMKRKSVLDVDGSNAAGKADHTGVRFMMRSMMIPSHALTMSARIRQAASVSEIAVVDKKTDVETGNKSTNNSKIYPTNTVEAASNLVVNTASIKAPTSSEASPSHSMASPGRAVSLQKIATDKERLKKENQMNALKKSVIHEERPWYEKMNPFARHRSTSGDDDLSMGSPDEVLKKIMPGIFLWNNGDAFFDTVDHMMMIISFYLALWLCNYASLCALVPNTTLWSFLTLIPGILSTMVYILCVRSAALLKAVTQMDADVLELTLEDAETARMLGHAVRKKILKRLQLNIDEAAQAQNHPEEAELKLDSGLHYDVIHHEPPHPHHIDMHPQHHHEPHHSDHVIGVHENNPSRHHHHKRLTKEEHLKKIENIEEELKRLFRMIDTDGSMLLSRSEFKEFLGELHISFSNKRWRQIFREMDRNYDDSISFDELFLFLFPDHNVALAREKKRLKLVGERVRKYRTGSAGDPPPLDPDGKAVLVSSGSLYDLTTASAKKDGKKDGNKDKNYTRTTAYAVDDSIEKEKKMEDVNSNDKNAVKSFEQEL